MLIYLTLDLSLPAMPGAFVFEAADSAEGTQVRVHAETEAVALPALARGPGFVLFHPFEGDEWLAPVSSAKRRARPIGSWQSRAQYDPAPPSEDPY